MSDNPEDEPTGEQGEDSSEPEGIANIELSPEQESVLNQKREQLLEGDTFAFRFVHTREYQDKIRHQEIERPLEVIEMNIDQFLLGDVGHAAASRDVPEKTGWLWSGVASRRTGWDISSSAVAEEAALLRNYHELRKETSAKEARAIFTTRLKGEVAEYLFGIYIDRWKKLDLEGKAPEEHFYSPWLGWRHKGMEWDDPKNKNREDDLDLPFRQYAELLDEPNRAISEEDRERLQEIMRKNPYECVKSDRKFLMRFAKGTNLARLKESHPDTVSKDSTLPYELLEIWGKGTSKKGINPWEDSRGYTAMPKGTKVSKLIGVVAISPTDNESLQRLAQEMVEASKDDPSRAHLIINARLYEFFPQYGTDLFAKR